ncbi:MAG: carboxyl transferase [Oscillospiraceae bacterium]|nr:carboxyl transferase [Oscillospiraceae bacterium]
MNTLTRAEAFAGAGETHTVTTPARERLKLLFDPGSFVEIDRFASVGDDPCGVVCGYGAVGGSLACAFAQEGGGLGKMQADKIAKLYDLAGKTGVSVVGIYDSNGARVSEGVGALEAYGQLLLRINNLSGVVPQIAVVAGNCTGACAMLACSADFLVMSGDSRFFMTPPALVEDNTPDTGSPDSASKAGIAHILADTVDGAIERARKLLSYLPVNNLAALPSLNFAEPATVLAPGDCQGIRPATLAFSIFDADSLVELLDGFGSSAYTALGSLGGNPVGVAGTIGKLDADSCVKLAKVVSVCDAFQIPVITLVNSDGFAPSAKAELSGSVREMAKLGHVYAEATTPKASVITGKAYGAAYIALASRAANSDYTIAWPEAIISALEPAGAVELLYADEISAERSRETILRDYLAETASPLAGAKSGYLDDVVSPEQTRASLLSAMELLSAKRVQRSPKKHSNLPL